MANQILAGAVINAGMIIAGVDADNPPVTETNIALTATSTASTHISNLPPSLAHDGIIGISDTDGSTISGVNAWVTTAEGVGAWMQLDWSTPQIVNKIKLYDRPNVTHDHIKGGTLTFSDGSSVTVGALPDGVVDGAPDPLEITFNARVITWVRFTVDAFTGHNAGLTEFEVFGYQAPNLFQASLSDWTIVAGSVSQPTFGTFGWTRDGGSGWVAGYEVSGLTVGTEYTISYEMRKTGGPGPVEMRITPALGGGATLTNQITESSEFVKFTNTWTQPDQTTAYVNIISDNGGGSGEIRNVSIVGPIPNEPPVISGIDASYTLTQGQDTVVTAVVTDPEDDAITWSHNIAGELSASDFTITDPYSQMYSTNLGTSANGLTLTIDPVGSPWQSYQNLPTYLTGLLCTTGINEGDGLSFTIPACTVYMLRVPSWSTVNTNGWTEVESGQSYITGYGGVNVYSREFSAGTYSFDNTSAMYMFAGETIDMTVSQTDNVFTITPGTTDISTQITFTATDSAGNATSVSSDITFAAPAQTSAKWAVVGVPRDNGEIGSAYVYDATDLSATPTKLTAFDGVGSDRFGWSVASTNDKIVVGSYYDDDNGTNSGSVYVYDANNLSATPTKLTAFDGTQHDNFGQSVAATADNIVVGAPNDGDGGEGSVYVFDANNLSTQPMKLTAFDGTTYDTFGHSVAVTADNIVVGTYGDDDGGSNSGSVYVYDANDLTAQPTKLLPPDIAANDFFGLSVASFGDMIVVGSPNDDDGGSNSGSVYVYDATDLTAQPTKLTAFDAAVGDKFGYSVASINDKIVVGARDDQDNGTESGSVYVFDANDLSAQPTKLTAFDGVAGDFFGRSVAAFGDKIIVGSHYDDDNGDRSGSVYVYDANDLSATPTKLTAFDGGEYDQFGESVAIG